MEIIRYQGNFNRSFKKYKKRRNSLNKFCFLVEFSLQCVAIVKSCFFVSIPLSHQIKLALFPVSETQVRASSAKDMDSHFLWELIHLRSQLQRRSEKVYVLSNSTADFRNAFLKTIRQIIRESVRNMSIPMKGMGSNNSLADLPPVHRGSTGNSQTLERPKQQIVI